MTAGRGEPVGGAAPGSMKPSIGPRDGSTMSLSSLASSCDTVVAGSSEGFPMAHVPHAGLLGEIRRECLERGQDKAFLDAIFKDRCKQLYPRDLLCVQVPTKKGGLRPVGMLRRTLRFNKQLGCNQVVIDFLYVLKSHRGMGLGRRLLEAGMLSGKKPKPCKLLVAGSEENVVAVKLYESLGFSWCSELRTDMSAPAAAVEALMSRSGVLAIPPPPAPGANALAGDDASPERRPASPLVPAPTPAELPA